MKLVIHQGMVKADSLRLPASATPTSGMSTNSHLQSGRGWYSSEQAAAGAKLFEDSCSGCHGAKLEGGSAPALTGVTWQQRFGGAKLLTVWGEIKGPMAEYAGKQLSPHSNLSIFSPTYCSRTGCPRETSLSLTPENFPTLFPKSSCELH